MSYRIYEDIRAYVGPDGGAVLVGMYHTNNGGIFMEEDGTRPGSSELSVYVAESIEALKRHLMERQFERPMSPAARLGAETEGVFDCVVKGAYCEWKGLLKAQLDALSSPISIGRDVNVWDESHRMTGMEHSELCAMRLERIIGMVAEGGREFFGRIRKSNAEAHPVWRRRDDPLPISSLEEAKMFDNLFGYWEAVPYLPDDIRNDLGKLTDYFHVSFGMEDNVFESVMFYLAASKRLLLENFDQIVKARGKVHTYPLIPDEVKAQFPPEYTVKLLREGTIRYDDIPEEVKEDPVFVRLREGLESLEEMVTESAGAAGKAGTGAEISAGAEVSELSERESVPRAVIEENLACLQGLSEFYGEQTGARLSLIPVIEDENGDEIEEEWIYEVSLSMAGHVFYFTADSFDPEMAGGLYDEMKAVSEWQTVPEIKDMLLKAAGYVKGERMEAMLKETETEKDEVIEEAKEEQSQGKVFTGTFADYFDYGMAL